MIKFAQVMVITTVLSGVMNVVAVAVTVTNSDSAAQTIIVTEGESKFELVIASGETVNVCPLGCFVTMPDGDRVVLNGSEAVTIRGGQARIK